MLRSIWQRAVDYVYDAVSAVFKTQDEIDLTIEGELSKVGTYHDGVEDVPLTATLRPRQFWYPEDVVKYVADSGIPTSCVHIAKRDNWDEDGNPIYQVYILPNTP